MRLRCKKQQCYLTETTNIEYRYCTAYHLTACSVHLVCVAPLDEQLEQHVHPSVVPCDSQEKGSYNPTNIAQLRKNLKKTLSKKLGDSFVDPDPVPKIAHKKQKIKADNLLKT
jgi:hypothetical protein